MDDIVTRLRYIYSQKDVGVSLNPETFVEAADEIERLRELLNNTLERENKDNARQLEIVRKVEADRDRWIDIAQAKAVRGE